MSLDWEYWIPIVVGLIGVGVALISQFFLNRKVAFDKRAKSAERLDVYVQEGMIRNYNSTSQILPAMLYSLIGEATNFPDDIFEIVLEFFARMSKEDIIDIRDIEREFGKHIMSLNSKDGICKFLEMPKYNSVRDMFDEVIQIIRKREG